MQLLISTLLHRSMCAVMQTSMGELWKEEIHAKKSAKCVWTKYWPDRIFLIKIKKIKKDLKTFVNDSDIKKSVNLQYPHSGRAKVKASFSITCTKPSSYLLKKHTLIIFWTLWSQKIYKTPIFKVSLCSPRLWRIESFSVL